jgi:hypothetical protein
VKNEDEALITIAVIKLKKEQNILSKNLPNILDITN